MTPGNVMFSAGSVWLPECLHTALLWFFFNKENLKKDKTTVSAWLNSSLRGLSTGSLVWCPWIGWLGDGALSQEGRLIYLLLLACHPHRQRTCHCQLSDFSPHLQVIVCALLVIRQFATTSAGMITEPVLQSLVGLHYSCIMFLLREWKDKASGESLFVASLSVWLVVCVCLICGTFSDRNGSDLLLHANYQHHWAELVVAGASAAR